MSDVSHARPSLIADTIAYEPGTPLTLGLTFDIDEHWHLYWNGANDSGFAPTIDLDLPEGWTIGPWQWPAPMRYESAPGQILDFIYESRVTLFATLNPAAESRGSVTVRAATEWLVCQEACIPGYAELTLTLPPGAPAPSPQVARFEEARARLPQPLDAESIARFSWSWSRGALRITSHEPVWMTFAPGTDAPDLLDRFRGTRSKPGETLVIGLERAEPEARLCGVLELFDAGKQSQAIYYLDIPLGQLPSPAEAPAAPANHSPLR